MSEPIFRLPPFTIEEVVIPLSQTVDWGHAAIGLPEAWKRTRGRGAVVAVLDTGVAATHPDLTDQVNDSRDFSGSASGPTDRSGHGTHCCGIIAAVDNDTGVIGVAPDAKLLSGKVLGDDDAGGSSGIAAGIRWAVSKGAHVISMSFGSRNPSRVIHNAIQEAVAGGCLLIAAAGNDGPGENTTGYPSGHPECVSVAAFDPENRIARFSSRGKVDVAAPGVGILSTVPTSRYAKMSGTSMATPYVAGVAALVVSQCLQSNQRIPDVATFRSLLRRACIDAGQLGHDSTWGWGLIDPAFLMESTDPTPPSLR